MAAQRHCRQLLSAASSCLSRCWQEQHLLFLPEQLPSNTIFNAHRSFAVTQASKPTAQQVPQQEVQHSYQQYQQQQQQQQPQGKNVNVHKIYRGKWILPVRLLVRAKIFQLMGGGSIGVLLGSLTMQDANWLDVLALTGLAGGMVAASYCLWYYSRRYVGEMALLLPDLQVVRLSVLDFWGNREDNDVPLSAIQPPFKGVRQKEMNRIASQLLFPLNVANDRQYYLSTHAGQLLDRQAFLEILKGEFTPSKYAQQLQQQSSSHSSDG